MPSVPSRPDSTESRDADAPFNDKNADIILRSSDYVSFHTYKSILSLASPVFQAMFSLPQPANTHPPKLTITPGDPPTIDVAEDARTLDLILRCCYPVRRPSITQLSDVHRVLEAGRKYDLDAATAAESALTACTTHDALGAFALACHYQLRQTCTAVARRTLAYEFGALDAPAQVDLMSVTQYRALVAYHARCCAAAADVARRGREAWMLASQDGLLADEWQHALTNRSYPCKACASALGPDENLYAPKEVWDTLRRAGDALAQRICVGGEVWDAWAPEKPRCDGCKRTYDRLKLWRAFATEVERAVAAVEVPQFF